MIGFTFVAISRPEARSRFVDVSLSENCVDMAWHEIVSEFMSDAEVLESEIIDVRGIRDSIRIAHSQQHSGNALCAWVLGHDLDVELASKRYRIYGKRVDLVFLDDLPRLQHGPPCQL